MWLLFAFGSAFFAGITAILAKAGIKNVDSHLATALRTGVVLIFAWLMVFITGAHKGAVISGYTLTFLILSGITTGASWLCYFKALQMGDVNKVVPIDKSSVIMTMILAFIFLGEPFTLQMCVGMAGIGIGTWLMIQKKPECAAEPGQHPAGMKPGCTAAQEWPQSDSLQQERPQPDTLRMAMTKRPPKNPAWLLYAFGSAVFASLTSILGKIGISGIDSNLGTAIRTIVVLIMAWMIVFITKKQKEIGSIDKKSWLFLVFSGIATGLSWLCYYRALQDGKASIVVPVDKLSILVSVCLAGVFFRERLSRRGILGLVLIVNGTLVLLY